MSRLRYKPFVGVSCVLSCFIMLNVRIENPSTWIVVVVHGTPVALTTRLKQWPLNFSLIFFFFLVLPQHPSTHKLSKALKGKPNVRLVCLDLDRLGIVTSYSLCKRTLRPCTLEPVGDVEGTHRVLRLRWYLCGSPLVSVSGLGPNHPFTV